MEMKLNNALSYFKNVRWIDMNIDPRKYPDEASVDLSSVDVFERHGYIMVHVNFMMGSIHALGVWYQKVEPDTLT